MPEPLLKILARFDINEKPSPLDGRAYLSAYNFEKAYNSDLVYAVKQLRQIVQNPQLEEARNMGYKHTVAIMWGQEQDGTVSQMIDFLLWEFATGEENAEILTLPTRNGEIIKPRKDGSLGVTCEGGSEILIAEKNYRKRQNLSIFRNFGPEMQLMGLNPAYDFCSPTGRERLTELLKCDHYPILDTK